jgi:hypothetical protein
MAKFRIFTMPRDAERMKKYLGPRWYDPLLNWWDDVCYERYRRRMARYQQKERKEARMRDQEIDEGEG